MLNEENYFMKKNEENKNSFFFHIFTMFFLLGSTTVVLADSDVEEFKNLNIPLFIVETEGGVKPKCSFLYPPEGCIGKTITNNEYVRGRLVVIMENDTMYDSGDYIEDESGMRIRIRGNTSADYRCPPYKMKLEKKFNLFFYQDRSKTKEYNFLRTTSARFLNPFLGNRLGELLGLDWQPGNQYVNIFLNGKYQGLYLMTDVVKKGKNHCDVSSEGYLMEHDPYWWAEEGAVFHSNYLADFMGYTFKYPETMDSASLDYIRDYIHSFERDLYAGKSVEKWIDYESFAAWVLGHDILGSHDAAGSNIYITKYDSTEASKLKMGPLWDFDAILQEEEHSAIHYNGKCFYYPQLFMLEEFCEAYEQKWNEVKGVLYDEIMNMVDSLVVNYGSSIDFSIEASERLYGLEYPSMAENRAMISEWMLNRLEMYETSTDEVFSMMHEEYDVKIFDMYGRLINISSTLQNDCLPKGVYVKCFYKNGVMVWAERCVVK